MLGPSWTILAIGFFSFVGARISPARVQPSGEAVS